MMNLVFNSSSNFPFMKIIIYDGHLKKHTAPALMYISLMANWCKQWIWLINIIAASILCNVIDVINKYTGLKTHHVKYSSCYVQGPWQFFLWFWRNERTVVMFCLAVLQTKRLKNRADCIAFIFKKVYILTMQILKSLSILWIVVINAKNQRFPYFREIKEAMLLFNTSQYCCKCPKAIQIEFNNTCKCNKSWTILKYHAVYKLYYMYLWKYMCCLINWPTWNSQSLVVKCILFDKCILPYHIVDHLLQTLLHSWFRCTHTVSWGRVSGYK